MNDSIRLSVGMVGHHVVRGDGEGRALLELARGLHGRGHLVRIYSHELDDELAGVVEHVLLTEPPGPQLVDDLTTLVVATRRLREAAHDVVVVLGPCARPDPPYVYAAQFSQRGWQRTWRPGARPGGYHRLHSRLMTPLERRAVRHASATLATTPRLAGELGDGPPVTLVPNGIDLDEFPVVSPAERQRVRGELGLPTDARVVGFVGEYHTNRKGLAPLLEACSRGDEHLLVAGSGRSEWLDRRAAEMGIAPRVHRLGFVAPQHVYAAADTVAVPSLYEPFSLVAVEAAASGLPTVLSSDVGAAAYLGDAAVVVEDVTDVAALRAALDEVSDPATAARLRKAARPAAEALAWDRVIPAAVDLVEKVARGGRP